MVLRQANRDNLFKDYEIQQLLDRILPKTHTVQEIGQAYWGQEIRAILNNAPHSSLTDHQMRYLKENELIVRTAITHTGEVYAFTEKAHQYLKPERKSDA